MTKQEVSRKLNVSLTTITNWIAEGLPCVTKGKRGRGYDFDIKSVEEWVKKYKLPASTGDMSYAEARRRKEAAIAAIREIEVEVRRGHLLNKEQLIRDWSRVMIGFRNKLMALPTRLAPQVYGCKTPGEAFSILQKHIRDVLVELADSNFDTAGRKKVSRKKGKT